MHGKQNMKLGASVSVHCENGGSSADGSECITINMFCM